MWNRGHFGLFNIQFVGKYQNWRGTPFKNIQNPQSQKKWKGDPLLSSGEKGNESNEKLSALSRDWNTRPLGFLNRLTLATRKYWGSSVVRRKKISSLLVGHFFQKLRLKTVQRGFLTHDCCCPMSTKPGTVANHHAKWKFLRLVVSSRDCWKIS